MPSSADSFEVRSTKIGLRLSQHGVVLSELRTSPGPTHSVFDVLAAVIASATTSGRVGILGFAGGGILAPLRGLEVTAPVDAVDLERGGYDLFRQHCAGWAGPVNWEEADAVVWLKRQPPSFSVLVDDLSIPVNGDVIKPAITWDVLPELIRDRLAPGGTGVFNLLLPPRGVWGPDLIRIGGLFRTAHVIELDEFQNRILVGGDALAPAREFGVQIRLLLRRVRSRHATRIRIQSLR